MSDIQPPHKLMGSSNTQQNANQTQNNDSLIERYPIIGTPFTEIKHKGQWFLTIGIHGLTPPMNSREELHAWMETDKWNLIFNMVVSMLNYQDEINEVSRSEKTKHDEELKQRMENFNDQF